MHPNIKQSPWIAIVIVIVLISLIIIYTQSNSTLDAPTGVGVSVVTSESTPDEVSLQSYNDEASGFSISVPIDWTKVIKDGYVTYIHSPSATSVQIQKFSYSPSLLLINAEQIQSELKDAGCELTDFSWTSNTSYTTIYRSKLSGCAYVENTIFDRKTALRIVFTVKEQYAEVMADSIAVVVDSFKWTPKDPFPDGTIPYYSTYGNFEFVYPSGWATGTANNTILAQCPETGTVMSISVNQSNVTYEKYTQLDYVNYASNGRQQFLLKSYSADKNVIYAESTYSANNVQMILIQYLIATGEFEYAITFEVPQTAFESKATIIKYVISTFKIYQ